MKTNNQTLRQWWKKYHVGRSKSRAEELEYWNENVTFDDVRNLIRANGPQDPERGVDELIWKPGAYNTAYATQELYREMARRYNIHGGKIDLPWHPDYGVCGAGVDYKNFLTKWIHE